MNYIIFDLEFNQAWDFEEHTSPVNSKYPFEIVQISALKLDENLQSLSTFDRLVKPELYTGLHPFIEQITGISIEDLASAKAFKEIYEEFIQLISPESILCMWGISDMKELLRNAKYHNLDTSIIPDKYINIQLYASRYLHCPKGTNVGLRNAVELFNIPPGGRFHDAFNDACYTAEVFRRIYSHDIKPALYHSNKEIRLTGTTKKTKLDTDALIKQFEKMYNRQMTEEERSIIKLAYIMGKTSQFQSE
ncbi:MAG TPA: 3'-5' exonuclease [Clostridia bacterium]|nr:3'-5' exonuclease [Clostridia bacterium]